jgi:hypothetical protein
LRCRAPGAIDWARLSAAGIVRLLHAFEATRHGPSVVCLGGLVSKPEVLKHAETCGRQPVSGGAVGVILDGPLQERELSHLSLGMAVFIFAMQKPPVAIRL